MKTCVAVFLALLVSACSGSQTTPSTNTPATTAQSPANSAAPQKALNQASSAPVELVSCELTPDKTNVAYRIKVNTDKPIEEVHLALKEIGAGGKPLEEPTLIWKNIVGSTRRPIESGKTYEDQSPLEDGVLKVECSLKEVVFKDGPNWVAK